MKKLFTAGLLGLLGYYSYAQTPLTSWSTTTQSFTTSSLTNVTAPSDAGGSLTALADYTINHLVGTEFILNTTSLTTASASYAGDSSFPDTVIVRMRDSTTPIYVWEAMEAAGISGTTITVSPGVPTSYDAILNGLTMESGLEKLFANTDNVHSNRVNSDTERLDIIWRTGLAATTPSDQVFVLFDRGGDATIQVAAITGLDTNGDPSAFGALASIGASDWSSTNTLDTSPLISRKISEDDEPKPLLDISNEEVQGLVVTFDELGISTDEVIYGYAVFANDVSAGSHTLTNILTYPTNTTATSSNYDPVSGGFLAKSVSADQLFTAQGPGGYLPAMRTWLKADAGVTTATEGGTVTLWEDQSQGSHDFSPITNSPTYRSSTNLINSNPTLEFGQAASETGLQISANSDYNSSSAGYTSKGIYIAFRTDSDVTTRQAIYEEGGGSSAMTMYIDSGTLYCSIYQRVSAGTGSPFNTGNPINVISTTIAADTEYILAFEFTGSTTFDGTLKAYLNGEQFGTLSGLGILYAHTDGIGLGENDGATLTHDGATAPGGFKGGISEFVYRNNATSLDNATRQRIESYLALKYGITLDQSVPNDYVNSGGTVVFDATNTVATGGFLEYNNNIAGIGRDDQSGLLQTTSQSEVSGSVLSISAAGSIFDDNSWLIWGHDGGALTTTAMADTIANADNRWTRVWRAAETGEVGMVNISFDLTGLGLSTDAQFFGLVIDDKDSEGSFTVPLRMETGGTFSGDVLTFSNVDLDDGQYFTLALDATTVTPVPFHKGLSFWLGADTEVTPGTDATAITNWGDQGRLANDAADDVIFTDPVYRSSTSLINGYPVIDFSGATDAGFQIENDDAINTASSTYITIGLVFRTGTDVTTQQLIYQQGAISQGLHIYIEDEEIRASLYNSTGTAWNNSSSPPPFVEATVNPSTTYLYLLRYEVPNPASAATENKITAELNNVSSLTEITGVQTLTAHTGEIGLGSRIGTTRGLNSSTGFSGQIAEMIYVDDHILLLDENNTTGIAVQDPAQWISDYLSLKYGFWDSGDIYLSDGLTKIFESSSFTFDNDGIAIVRDDDWGLLSKQATSQSTGTILTMGLGGIAASQAANSGTFTNDRSAIVITHSQTSTSHANANTSDVPTGYFERMGRIWEVKETGEVGAVTLQFDLSGLGYTTDADQFALILGSDSTMANGTTTAATAYDSGTGVLTFDNVSFSSNSTQFMSLATVNGKGPGGVFSNLRLWLKADQQVYTTGTTAATDGESVETWADQSISEADAFDPLKFTTFETDEASFNPAINFTQDNKPLEGTVTTSLAGMTFFLVGNRLNIADRPFFEFNDGTNGTFFSESQYSSTTDFTSNINHNSWNFWSIDHPSGNTVDIIQNGTLFETFFNADLSNAASGTYSYALGSGIDASGRYQGSIGEVILFQGILTSTETQQVESYLALKYGITLSNDDDNDTNLGEALSGSVTEGDYLNGSGSVIWDYSTNASYHNNVAGIGRDDSSELNQKQGRSEDSGAMLSMGLGSITATNEANANTFDSDGDFLIWGHDGASANRSNTNLADVPAGVTERMLRIWKVQETGAVGVTELQFDVSGLGYGTEASDFKLIVSNSSTMANGTTLDAAAYDAANDIVSFTGVDFQDAQFFTLGMATPASSPGGVSTNLKFWLRADQQVYNTGTTLATDGQTVETWADQSATVADASDPDDLTTFETNEVNFNPAISFDADPQSLRASFTTTVDGLTMFTAANYNSSSSTPGNIFEVTGGSAHRHLLRDTQYGANASFTTSINEDSWNFWSIDHPLGQVADISQNGASFEAGFTALNSSGQARNYIVHLGDGRLGGQAFTGFIGELIVYQGALTALETQRVESYLALKYARTLSNDDDGDSTPGEVISGSVTEGDYLNSSESIIWDYSANAVYHNQVAGIGRDDGSELNQKQAKNEGVGAILTMSLGSIAATNEANAETFSDDGDFLIWGHNGMAANQNNVNTEDLPSGIGQRLGRVWKVQDTGEAGAITIQFNLTGLGFSPDLSNYKLIISNSSTMAGGTTIDVTTFDGVSNTATFSAVDLQDGQFFTLGMDLLASPGGVTNNLKLWLRADQQVYNTGTTSATDGQTVATWADQSASSADATDSDDLTTFETNEVNFNPAVEFANDATSLEGSFTTTIDGVTIFTAAYNSSASSVHDALFEIETNTNNRMFVANGRYAGLTSFSSALTLDQWKFLTIDHPVGSTAHISENGSEHEINYGTTRSLGLGGSFDYVLGDDITGGNDFTGFLGDVIVYQGTLTALETQQVESYLALKYGIMLSNDDDADTNLGEVLSGTVTEGDYLNSMGEVIWDYSIHSTYHNDVAGIGRDDLSGLDQKQSQSESGGILTIGLGSLASTNEGNTNSFENHGDFLIWGHDAGATIQAGANTGDLPTGISERMTRVWKVQNTGSVTGLTVQFDLTGLNYGTDIDDFKLIISNSSTMASGSIVSASSYSAVNNTVTFLGIDLADGQFFALGTKTSGAPGGVSTDLYVWLKANQGTSTITDNSTITTWTDQSSNALAVTSDGNPPLYKDNTTDNINFNPVIDFDGTNDRLVLGNLANIKTGSTNGGDYTLVGVGLREDGAQNYLIGSQGSENNNDLGFGHADDASLGARLFHWNNDLNLTGANTYNSPGFSPYLLYGTFNTGTRILEETRDGSYVRGSQTSITALGGSRTNYVGAVLSGSHYFNGLIPEIIIYENDLSEADEQKVNSYMALKYGISLTNDNDDDANLGETISGAVTEGDYVSSGDVVIWDYSANSTYHNEVAGIGKDDASILNQRQSQSQHNSSILTIGLGSIASSNSANANNFGDDGDFLVWGHDDASALETGTNTSDLSFGLDERMSRVWKVQNTGSVGAVAVQFDLTGLGYDLDGTDFTLIVSNSSTMANGTTTEASAYDAVNNTVDFSGISLADGQFFTLGMSSKPAPGGVSTNLKLWLRADQQVYNTGTTAATDGQTVSTWADQTINGSDAADPSGLTTFETNAVNFNPAVAFDNDAKSLEGSITTTTAGLSIFLAGNSNTVSGADRALFEFKNGSNRGFFTNRWYAGTIDDFTVDINRDSWNFWSFDHPSGNSADIYQNGTLFEDAHNAASSSAPSGTYSYVLGDDDTGGNELVGSIGEVILYEGTLTAVERQRVESYLALKYGRTLSSDDDGDSNLGEVLSGGITEGDYLNSAAGVIWDYTANSIYHNNVSGIGRDDLSALAQKQATSEESGAVLTMALGSIAATNEANANNFDDDGDFLIWGHDNGTTAQASANVSDLPAGIRERISRVWKVQNTGAVSGLTVQFDLTGLGYGTSADDFKLIISNSSTMANGTVTDASAYDAVNNTVSFAGISLADGQFFSLGTATTGAPGGVDTNLVLWLRADERVYNTGTTAATDGQTVASWIDQSVSGADGTDPSNLTTFETNTINFNPAIEFANDATSLEGTFTTTTAGLTQFTVGFFNSSSGANDALYEYRGGTSDDRSFLAGGRYGGTNTFTTALTEDSWKVWRVDHPSGTIANIYENSALLNGSYSTSLGDAGLGTYNYTLGDQDNGTRDFEGFLGEVITYQGTLTDFEELKVETYLAVKYGIQLSADRDGDTSLGEVVSGSITEGDYVTSINAVIWDYSANSSYHNGVAGIGRDDDSVLTQKQSKSQESGSILTIGLGGVAATNQENVNSFNDDGDFLVWGHDGASTERTSVNTNDVPSGVEQRMSRVWKAQDTGEVGATEIEFDLTGLGYSTDVSDFKLIIASTSTMASGTTTNATAYDAVNNILSFSGVNLTDGQFFTLGMNRPSAPGGIDANLVLWLRADQQVFNTGTTSATDGQTVETWADQSTSEADASDPSDLTTYETNSVNFNPAIEFTSDATSLEGTFTTSTAGLTQFTVGFLNSSSLANAALYEYRGGTSDDRSFLASSRYGGTNSFPTALTEDIWTLWRVDHPSGTVANIYENSALLNGTYSTSLGDAGLGTYNYTLGDQDNGTKAFDGFLGEVITYQGTLTDLEELKIETYLALKYGIHLSEDRDGDDVAGEVVSSSITEGDYVSSEDVVIWDYSAHSAYHNGVTGIGNDELSVLDQKQAKSSNSGSIVSIGYGTLAATNEANANSASAGQFVLWGHNGGTTTAASMNNTDVPGGTGRRLDRVWKVQVTGTAPTNLQLNFDLTGGGHTDGSNYTLLQSSTSSFADASLVANVSVSGNQVTYSNIMLIDGQYFTIAELAGPGGLTSDLALWIRAEDEIGLSSSGASREVTDISSLDRDAVATRLGSGSNANVSASTDAAGKYLEFGDTNSTDGEYLKTENGNDLSGDLTLFTVFRTLQIGGSVTNFEDAPTFVSSGTTAFSSDYGLGISDGLLHFNADNTSGLTVRSPGGTIYNDNNWHVVAGVRQQASSAGSVKLYADGLEVASGNSVNVALDAGAAFGIGNHADPTVGSQFDGDLREVIAFSNDLTQTQVEQVSSYLALKHDFTLSSDYRDSQGNVVWNSSLDNDYNNRITGVFKDHLTSLSRITSQSLNQDPSTGDFTASAGDGVLHLSASSLNDGEYFLIGDNNDSWAGSTKNFDRDQVRSRLKRQWMAQVNYSGAVDIVFLIPTSEYNINAITTPLLMVDNDGDFTSGTTYINVSSFTSGHSITANGEQVDAHEFRFSNVSLTNGQYFTLGANEAGGLPIQFLSIEARRDKEGKAMVSWTVADSDGKEIYAVQRGANGFDFQNIGERVAPDDHGSLIGLDYLDAEAPSQRVYYRIVQTDPGGGSNYSDVVMVDKFEDRAELELLPFPNPVRGTELNATYKIPDEVGEAEIHLYSGQGLLVRRYPIYDVEGTEKIDIRGLSSGIYLLQLLTHQGKKTKRILIQK